MRKNIIFLFFWFFIVSCQEGNIVKFLPRLSDSFSPKERQALFPNKLFIAIVDQKEESVLLEIINQNGHYILEENNNGDTALAIAIKFYNPQGALFIAKQLSPDHYLQTNLKGEGYLYLASGRGYVELIQFLAQKFYESRQALIDDKDYEFSDLDMKTHEGERALHVAKNYMTAEALKNEYWRGVMEFPLRKFQFLQNNKEQTFLHTAVRDQNSDLIRWGLDQNCSSRKEWEEKGLIEKWFSFIWQSIQLYGKDVAFDWDDLINTEDNEGRTAINFSAQNMFLDGIRIFASCQWIDYLSKDNYGNIPLQNFLLSLDSTKPDYESEVKDGFTLLMESQTRLTWSALSTHINSVNNDLDSSLHISARLADPFFYNSLKKYGDIEQENHEGRTPREIFESQKRELKKAQTEMKRF